MEKKILRFYLLFVFPIFLTCAFILLVSSAGYSQSLAKNSSNTIKGAAGTNEKSFKANWETNPFDHQVFIENKGQFDEVIPGQKVLYTVNLGDIQAFFTATGIVYRITTYPISDIPKGQDPDQNGPPKPVIKYLYSKWEGANNNAVIGKDEKQSYYYTYPSGTKESIKTDIYKKITYHNLYPGIDVEYSFKEGKPGIEYKLIVHPGADISHARLLYGKGAVNSKINAKGDIDIQTNMGVFTVSSPQGFYADDNSPLKVSFLLNGNEQSFSVVNPDINKTYVIDPWVTDPLFSVIDRAYDLDYDNYGNVYVYGGNPSILLQLVKLSNRGAILWVYNASLVSDYYYGDFCTDKVTGTSYLICGLPGIAIKVNTNGSLVGSFNGNAQLDECWRTEFDACNGDIVVAGGGTSGVDQAGVLDSNMSSVNPVNIMGAVNSFHDLALLTIDPNGTQCYMASAFSVFGDHSFGDNMVMQLPLPSLSPTAYQVHEQLGFKEISSVSYVSGGAANGKPRIERLAVDEPRVRRVHPVQARNRRALQVGGDRRAHCGDTHRTRRSGSSSSIAKSRSSPAPGASAWMCSACAAIIGITTASDPRVLISAEVREMTASRANPGSAETDTPTACVFASGAVVGIVVEPLT